MHNAMIKSLIEKSLILMNKKYLESNEPVVKEFINKYNDILITLPNINQPQKKDFAKILNLTRMYLETSSDYSQNFIEAMYEAEKYIKKNI